MIPYFHIPALKILGPIAIQPFGVMVGFAVLFGVLLARRRCRTIGLSTEIFDKAVAWTLISGFLLSHLSSEIFYFHKELLANPQRLFDIRTGYSSFGGFFGAALGSSIILRREKVPYLLFADSLIFGFVPAWIFGRMGCTIAFDHPGMPTSFFLGMMDATGVVRHNLGFEEMLLTIPLTVVLYALRNVRPFLGFHTALVMLLYSSVRFPLDFLRLADETYLGLTPAQYASLAMFVLAVIMIVRGHKKLDPDITPVKPV